MKRMQGGGKGREKDREGMCEGNWAGEGYTLRGGCKCTESLHTKIQ